MFTVCTCPLHVMCLFCALGTQQPREYAALRKGTLLGSWQSPYAFWDNEESWLHQQCLKCKRNWVVIFNWKASMGSGFLNLAAGLNNSGSESRFHGLVVRSGWACRQGVWFTAWSQASTIYQSQSWFAFVLFVLSVKLVYWYFFKTS